MSAVSCLMDRSRGERLSLRGLADERIRKNVIEDLFFSYQLNLGSDLYSLSKNHQFIFVQTVSQVSLYSLVFRKVLWQCGYQLQNGYKEVRVKVFDTGVGLVVSMPKRFCSPNKTVLIFSEGNWTATIATHDKTIDVRFFKSAGDHLFVMSNNREKVHVWSLNGEKLGEIPTEGMNLGEKKKQVVASNQGYALWAMKNESELNVTATLFVLDLITWRKNIYNVKPNGDDVSIRLMEIFKNIVVCGVNRIKKKEPFRGFESLANPRIIEVNIATGRVEKSYILNGTEGEVKALAVNDNFISCVASPYFCVIDRKSNLIKNVHSVSYNLTFYRFSFSFSGDLFYASCLRHQQKEEELLNVLYVYDCLENKFIKINSYKSFPVQGFSSMSFQSGKLVILEGDKVYIEDFEEIRGVGEKKTDPTAFNIVNRCFRDS